MNRQRSGGEVTAPIDAWVMKAQRIGSPPKARRLKAIAAWVNANGEALGLRATVHASSASTDRQISGSHLRWPGKGRKGNEIEFYPLKGPRDALGMIRRVHRHNSAETYRSNDEVERWLANWIAKLPVKQRRKIEVP